MNPAVEVEFPSGKKMLVYPIRVFVQAQNAKFKADHGMFLPGCGKQHPTVKATREEYEIHPSVKTWKQLAEVLFDFHKSLNEALGIEA